MVRVFSDRGLFQKITSVVAFLVEFWVYVCLVLTYFFVGVRVLDSFLGQIFDYHRMFYAFLALGLICAQGFVLERLTSGVLMVTQRTQAFVSVLLRLSHPHETVVRPKNVPGLLVYRFAGPLFFFNATHFARRAQELIDSGDPPVKFFLINAEAIVDVDTTGVETLEELRNTLSNRNINMGLCEVKGNFREVLSNTSPPEDFTVYPSMAAALRELAGGKTKKDEKAGGA